jgi:DNA-binding MarR family transcriptional regulator
MSSSAHKLLIPYASEPFVAAGNIAELVTCRQMAVLHLIGANPGESTGPVARTLGVPKPSVTRCCDKLEKLGLIQRHKNTKDARTDARTVRLYVTEAGRRAIGQREAAA